MDAPIPTSPAGAEAYLLGLIDGASRIADDRGLDDRNVRLTIGMFYARRWISASQQQALLLKLMRRRAKIDADSQR